MQELLVEAGLEIIGILITALIAWVSFRVQEWLKVDKNRKQLQSVEDYAYLAIQAIEIAFNDLDGEEKFKQAKNRLYHWADKKNIPMDETELEVLIESAVKRLKDEGKEIKDIYKGDEYNE